MPRETTERIRQAYQRMGVRGWSRDRAHRLCAQLNCTTDELAALVCCNPNDMTKWINSDYVPPTVALHLAMIEGALYEVKYGVKSRIRMPIELLMDKEPHD